MLLMQVFLSLSLLACGINFQSRTRELASQQQAPQTSSDRARTSIEKETDIDQLRARALHVLQAEDTTWRAYMAYFRQVGTAVWSGFYISLILSTITYCTIYALRVETRTA
jgi:hypothetical protein